MNYNNLYKDFISLFPDYKSFFNLIQKENLIDDTDGMHISFGTVVIQFINKLVDLNDTEKLNKAFLFFESMETDSDPRVCEVLEFTVLEGIVSGGQEYLNKCKQFMLPETLKACTSVEQWFETE